MTVRIAVTLAKLEAALNQAAEIARAHFGAGGKAISHEMKANDTPVSRADIEIGWLLKDLLLRMTPDAAWRCEEEKEVDGAADADLLWILDPLDGTREFVRGIPEVGISVALVAAGHPVLGAVVNPITNEAGYWSVSEGLRFAGYPTKKPKAELSSVAASIASASRGEYERGSLGVFGAGLKEIRPLGSVAYKLLRVAAGQEQLYFSVEPKSEWDICGGAALVWAAGLEYVRFDGVPISFGSADVRIRSGAVAGPRKLVAEFMGTFREEIKECQLRIERGQVV